MKILFPIGSFYPSQQGGPCNSVYALAKRLVAAGQSVDVVTTSLDILPNSGIELDRWVTIDGISVYYKKMPGNSPRVYDALSLLRSELFINIIRARRYDLIHLTMLFTILSHQFASFAKKKRIPYVWSPRGSMLPRAIRRGPLKKKLFLETAWIKEGLVGSHYHATSDEEVRHIEKVVMQYTGYNVADRIYNIPNLVDNDVFVSGGEASPYAYKYILYLGRVHPIKKIENLIEAFARAKIDPAIKLVIAGWTGEDVAYTKILKRLVEKLKLKNRVIYSEKRIEGYEKTTLYKHAEVFVLPSESENFGIVVVESLAQGVPVIASNKTPWQILEESDAGYWVSNDSVSIAEGLNRFFSLNGDERNRLSKNSLTLAKKYNNEALISRYLNMYEETVKA
jgi:glycosyltransferase involved in cell wall biosynthesis